MKKWFAIMLFSFVLMIGGGSVEAASFRITASASKVNPNETFRVSVGGDCIGRVNLSVKNGTLSESSVWVEQNSQTVNVKAGNSGSVTITATPTVGFSDADGNEYKPGSRSVTVSIEVPSKPSTPSGGSNTPSTGNSSNQNTKPNTQTNSQPNRNQAKPTVNNQQTVVQEKSSNNLLSSLSINMGTLEPEFNANVTEYSVKLPKEAKTISLQAVCQDSKATVTGIGDISVEAGENIIAITVVAENGEERKYMLKAYVDETPNVYLTYKNTQIGVVRNLRDVVIPEGFSEKQHKVNEQEIRVYDNGHFSMIYGVDHENNKNFYMVDMEKNECIYKIIPITIQNHFFFLGDWQEEKEGFEISSRTIEEKEIMGYQFKNGFADYFLLSVMNKEGERLEYLYEAKEGTLQRYLGSAPVKYEEYEQLISKGKNQQIIIYSLITVIGVAIIGFAIVGFKLRKEKVDEEVH